jgi:hypothetical protein
MLDPGCSMLDPGCWMLVARYWLMDESFIELIGLIKLTDRGGFGDNPKFAIRNPKAKGCRISIKNQDLPFTSVKTSAYNKIT